MKITFRAEYTFELPDCKIDTLIGCVKKWLPLLVGDFITHVLHVFADDYSNRQNFPFTCAKCGKKRFIRKTRNAKPTTLKTIFCPVVLGQMQIKCKCCGKKMFITRNLLGIEPYAKMSCATSRILAIIGSLTSFRVSEKILGMFGVALNRMSVWRCVQKEGESIEFGLDTDEAASGQADGTGIPIQGIKKRGKELKVFIQEKCGGGIRIAGLGIGNYDAGWNKLFAPMLDTLKSFPRFLLVTDGDTSILKGLKGVSVIFQRCLWHIPHQLKYCLWKDGVPRKSSEWFDVLGRILDITAIRPLIKDEDEIRAVIDQKMERLNALIKRCRENGWNCCATYLANAMPDMFTAFENRLSGKTTSKVERVMRTVNLRINVGKWSMSGALNAMKVRLAHYYNGYDVPDDPSGIAVSRY